MSRACLSAIGDAIFFAMLILFVITISLAGIFVVKSNPMDKVYLVSESGEETYLGTVSEICNCGRPRDAHGRFTPAVGQSFSSLLCDIVARISTDSYATREPFTVEIR